MKAYVVCYGCGVDVGRNLCPDSFYRTWLALYEANRLKSEGYETKIVLTAGCPNELAEPNLSHHIAAKLTSLSWPITEILMNPVGKNTASETKAAIDLIKRNGEGLVVACTSWYHGLRVKLLWLIGFKKFVQVKVTPPTCTATPCPLSICAGRKRRGFWYWLRNEPIKLFPSVVRMIALSYKKPSV